MTKTRRNWCRRVRMLLLSLFMLFGVSEAVFAASSALSRCASASTDVKYWEYRKVFFARNGQMGLAKGNHNINGDGVNTALNRLLRKKASWSTQDHINNIEALIPKLNSFAGAPGIVGYVWLEIAKKALAHYSTDTLEKTHHIDIIAYGRIDQDNAQPHPTEAGFSYNTSNGSGHIWTTLCFEIRWNNGPAGPAQAPSSAPDAKIQYAVKTAVAECGFKVIQRGTPNPPENRIFVGSYMPFNTSDHPDLSGYEVKLEAINFLQGDTPAGFTCPPPPANGYVTLGGAHFDKDGDGTWVNFADGNHWFLFKASPEACVDMFFKTETPPSTLVDDNDPNTDDRPNYCMGRCTDPPAVNSGA